MNPLRQRSPPGEALPPGALAATSPAGAAVANGSTAVMPTPPGTNSVASPQGGAAAEAAAASPAEAAAPSKESSTTKAAAYEDLVTMLRQQSEEARENSAVFAKALQSQQEQYQQLFGEMQKVLQLHTQQQKPQKPPPMELSAATIQSLASLMQPAPPLQPGDTAASQQDSNGAAPAAGLTASSGSSNPLRESFDAINHNLQRLLREGTSKAEVAKLLNTLTMILQNPSRKVNTSSARFMTFREGAAAELLKLAGFQYQEPNYTFAPEQGQDSAQRVIDLIQEAQRNLDQAWASRPAPDAVGDARPSGEAVGAPPAAGGGSQPSSAPDMQAKAPGRPPEQGGTPAAAAAAAPWAAAGSDYHESSAASAAARPVYPADTNGEVRQVARPWASSVGPKQVTLPGPTRPGDDDRSDEASSSVAPAAALPQQQPAPQPVPQPPAQSSASSSAATSSTAGPPVAGAAMAHPAESQEWSPALAVAHPAESEGAASSQPAPSQQPPPQQHQQQQQQQMAIAHPAEGSAPMAHPAEGSSKSEEPQSGG
mmetsp:Transcript_15666/g.49050  ORF Transcript_15666/g.49050 Transcript_15666/m.49050 type:complete len:540 (+) Transcript_15666:3-1622(+)